MPDNETLSVADFFAFGSAAAEHSAQLRTRFNDADHLDAVPETDREKN